MRRPFAGGVAAVGLALTVAGISFTPPAWPQAVEHKPRLQSHSAMEHEMDRFRADLAALREAMIRFRELCRRERQAALKPHLKRVRDNMDRALAMEEQMQQDLNRGRMVSDSELRHRIRLLGEQVAHADRDERVGARGNRAARLFQSMNRVTLDGGRRARGAGHGRAAPVAVSEDMRRCARTRFGL